MIPVPFSKPWRILQPVMYRMMARRWVDAFFDTGALRLSTFAQFRRHADEQRLDDQEGQLQFEHVGHDRNGEPRYLSVNGDFGRNAYVLCGSMSNAPALNEEFGTDAYIAIQNTTRFAEAVAVHIPGFIGGNEGPCAYLSARTIERDLSPIPWEHLRCPEHPGKLNEPRVHAFLDQALGDHPYYLKHLSYARQVEYRLFWLTNREVDGHLDIMVPEAMRFCFADNHRFRGTQAVPDTTKPE
jgi:hypothetical protein